MLVPAVRARRSKLPFTWMQFLIVARREIFRKLLNRSFIVAMIGSLALVGAVAIFQYLQTSKSDKSMVVEAESAAVPLAQSLCAGWRGSGVVALCEPVEPGTAASQDVIRAQISLAGSESTLKVTVTIPESIAGSGTQVAHAIAWQWIAVERGAADDQVRVALAADGAKTQDVVTRQLFAAALGCGFLFAGLMVGQQLAVSIVEDKKLGVYDTLRQLMPLRALILGKLIANITISVVQMTLLLAALLLLRRALPSGLIESLGSSVLVAYVPLFVLGYLNVCLLGALIGLRSRNMDALRDASVPLNLGLMGMWFAAMYLQGMPQVILSYVPIVSSMVMPVRMVSEDVSTFSVVVAALLAVAGAIALTVPFRRATIDS